MSADPFDDLYRELILEHYKKPRNHGPIPTAPIHVEGVNPVCGDEIHIDMNVDDGVIKDIGFWGSGCSISQSSASMMTDRLKGRPASEAKDVMTEVRAMLIDGAPAGNDLGDLEALEGVAKLPVRVKCALLCWNVLDQGLTQAATTA